MQIQKPSDLARLVKTRRQAHGLTQQEVADDVGITRQSLARIERGHGGVSFDTVLRILEKLDIHLEAAPNSQRQLATPSFDDSLQRTTSGALVGGRNIDTSALAAAAAAATRNIDTSALAAAAAAATRNIDTSALAAAAAAATRNIDTSALAAAAAAATRNIDTSALAAAAAAATRNIDTSALAAAAAAATRNIDTSAQLSKWRTSLNELAIQVQQAAARTGSAVDTTEARKARIECSDRGWRSRSQGLGHRRSTSISRELR